MTEIQNKRAVIVTGASCGIGLATALKLQKEGYAVYGVSRRPYGGEFATFAADVNDTDAMKAIFEEIKTAHGGIYALVNNAGFGIAGAIEEASPEAIDAMIKTDLTAVITLTGQVMPYLEEGGRVINISSVGGAVPLPYQATYSAAKAGVEIFSRAVDMEWKTKGKHCCAVLPGDTKTGFTAARQTEGSDARAVRSVNKMAHDEEHGKSPDTVARAVLKCLKRKDPPLCVTVGTISKLEVLLVKLLPLRLVNFIVRKIYG